MRFGGLSQQVRSGHGKGEARWVIEGMFDPQMDLPVGSFDCILFNDVLEHMLAPELALRYARRLLTPGGVVVASIPNIRSFPTLWRLMFHGSWEYQDAGVLDRTHLRFFTKSSMVDMFEREGFALEKVCGINAFGNSQRQDAFVAVVSTSECPFSRQV